MAISKGDRFELTRDWRGQGAANFNNAHTKEISCVLPKGTVLVATEDVNMMATGFHCVIEDADAHEAEMVPAEIRSDPGYTGYSFVFFVGDIGALLADVAHSA